MKSFYYFRIWLFLISIMIFTSCGKYELPDNSAKNVCKDIDGNVYSTFTVGNQTWMTENLKVTKYRNGDPILTTTPKSKSVANEIEPRYYWSYNYNWDENFCLYYTWFAIIDTRNIAPEGWHVPTMEEWKILFNNIQKDSTQFNHEAYGYRCHLGTLVRDDPDKTLWATSSENDNNEAYFRAISIDNTELFLGTLGKDYGLPVLCLRNY